MLTALAIRDVISIQALDLDTTGGLTVLTGETGAGKSILLDSLGLALGQRGSADIVRPGARQGSVIATFELPAAHPAFVLAREHDLPNEDGVLIMRRAITAEGRSRAHVNDQPVSAGLLRQLGALLVDIHGQYDTAGLMNPATHLQILDDFADNAAVLTAVGEAWERWRAARAAVDKRRAAVATAKAEEDYLRHAVAALDELDPQPGEETTLADQRQLLLNRDRLLEVLRVVEADALGEDGAERRLAAALRVLDRRADQAGDRFDVLTAALGQAATLLDEASRHLRDAAEALAETSGSIDDIDDRLVALRGAARKHGCPIDELGTKREQMAQALALLDQQDTALAEGVRAAAAAGAAYSSVADALTARRHAAASALDRAVMAELAPLKLAKARFITGVTTRPMEAWGATGKDQVGFEVATDPGLPVGPLSKIASGGERARFMLALKVILADTAPATTLVFDEVDTGIGGAVADAVGERLARLGNRTQTLVVTHSPQVAARGDRHLLVRKIDQNGMTATDVAALGEPARRDELARMLSGAAITPEARAAAARLLADRAQR
jgi:DNA repair protein RecN (Recombination protein N)